MPRRAMPRVVVIVEHQDPKDAASLNRTEPRTPRSATCCSVALGSAGACDPCNARAAHVVHACAAGAPRYTAHMSELLPAPSLMLGSAPHCQHV